MVQPLKVLQPTLFVYLGQVCHHAPYNEGSKTRQDVTWSFLPIQMSSDQKFGCSGFKRDCTTQLHGGCTKPL